MQEIGTEADAEQAAEMLRLLGGQPRRDLTDGRFAFEIPSHLEETPTGRLLSVMHREASAVGITLRRTKKSWRAGNIKTSITYTARHGNQEIARCILESREGQSERSSAYKALARIRRAVRKAGYALQDSGMLPTVPLYGDYLLTNAHRQQLLDLGAFYNTCQHLWYSPVPTQDAVRAILKPRACLPVCGYDA